MDSLFATLVCEIMMHQENKGLIEKTENELIIFTEGMQGKQSAASAYLGHHSGVYIFVFVFVDISKNGRLRTFFLVSVCY